MAMPTSFPNMSVPGRGCTRCRACEDGPCSRCRRRSARGDCLRGISAPQCQRTLPTVDSANRLWPTNVAPRRVFSPVGQRVARSLSERWPAVRSRGKHSQRFKAINSRTGGAAWSLPLLIGSGNGRQDARPCFARLPVALLRNLRLGRGSSRFWLGLFCARCIRDARRSL
jgi:hypothetical protein